MKDIEILKEITVLYVEDDRQTRELYSENLKKRVKELYTAEDGHEGFNKYLEEKPDIIITDIQMPSSTGIEMARKIREIDENIPIIVTTAYNTVELLTESLHLDISGYLVKPINNKQLLSKLKTRAEAIIAKKEEDNKYKMLQAIINADSHLLAVTDLDEIIFANNTFMNFFNVEACSEFNKKYTKFVDIFMEQEEFIHKGQLKENEDFMELMLRTPATKRNVIVFDFNKFTPKAFYLKLTPIDRKNNKDIYLCTLIDISLMTQEKAQLQNKVYFDNLTNIYNRNKLDEVFEQELEHARRYKTPFSMILIDIDHFKSFNDTYGHLIGDEVLVKLAKTINKITRKTDTFGRWGGEEFIMVLPNTTKENAAIVAEHLRLDVEKIKHPIAGGITASFGVAQYEEGDNEESLYIKSDEALYKAKENGRNRVEIK
jgi:diguanylate cyclase (GGDEF)-like protein